MSLRKNEDTKKHEKTDNLMHTVWLILPQDAKMVVEYATDHNILADRYSSHIGR